MLNEKCGDSASCIRFALPELRVGTLDALLSLSDDLAKMGVLVEAVTAKIRRTLGELAGENAEVRETSARRTAHATPTLRPRPRRADTQRRARRFGRYLSDEESWKGWSAASWLRFASVFTPPDPLPRSLLVSQLSAMSVEGLPLRRYLNSFSWNEAKHPARRPLRETADKLGEGVQRLEEELKLRAAEYNALKGAVSAGARKAGGSLASRDLGDILSSAPPGTLVESEHLTTLVVEVPAHSAGEWCRRYEGLAPHVVPRSSRQLADEPDWGLHSVVLFKRTADAFRSAARDAGWTVRDYRFDAASAAASKGDAQRLVADASASKDALAEWCRTAFGEALSSLVHLAAVRLFVESILRYGLPPAFAPVLCAPEKKAEKRVRALLAAAYARGASAHWRQREEDAAKGEEVHPYVSVTINLP